MLVTSLPPEPRRTPEEPTTTLAEDVTALALANPPAPPLADDEPQVSIDVLGPIRFRGLPPTAKPLTPRMKELLVYLALHGPTTGADLEDLVEVWFGIVERQTIGAGSRTSHPTSCRNACATSGHTG